MPLKKNVLLGQMLLARDLISAEQLDSALKDKKNGGLIGQALVKMGFIEENELVPVLSEQLGIEHISLKDIKIEPDLIKKTPARFACYYGFVPVRMEKGVLMVALSDPLDTRTLDDLRLLLGCEVSSILAGRKDILDAINRNYGTGAETVERMIEAAEKESPTLPAKAASAGEVEDLAEDASIIGFVNQIIVEAYGEGSTDIHIEPYEDELRVRYRIDGLLHDASIPPTIRHFQEAVISRIKIMGNLDIAEKRLPQDGRIRFVSNGIDLDLRVSVLPTPYGESVNIRLLTTKVQYGLESLGLEEENLFILESLIKIPHGIIFVTGPTGSGKTTTLYACLNKINDKGRKILTIEDPIEYQIKGITQIQVHPKIDLVFAKGLRSMLRHDPDIMMVGEVRDKETAEITIRSALTGHLVFSTLHTNDAAGGITRLLDVGIEPYLVASSVVCFIAQRLVRRICPFCKREVRFSKAVLEKLEIKEVLPEMKFYEGKGCSKCKFTGYKGRIGIFELLTITDEIRELIFQKSSANKIREMAVAGGMKTLRHDGRQKVLKGITTPGEIIRVTQL